MRRCFDSGASPETPAWRKDVVPTHWDMFFKSAYPWPGLASTWVRMRGKTETELVLRPVS